MGALAETRGLRPENVGALVGVKAAISSDGMELDVGELLGCPDTILVGEGVLVGELVGMVGLLDGDIVVGTKVGLSEGATKGVFVGCDVGGGVGFPRG